MLDFIHSIFGAYVPLEGTGVETLNFEMIFIYCIFLIFLVSVFKLLGVILKAIFKWN